MYVDARETSGWPPYPGTRGGARSVRREGARRGVVDAWLRWTSVRGNFAISAAQAGVSVRTERWGSSEGVIKSSFCP